MSYVVCGTSSPILAPITNYAQGIQYIDGYSLCYFWFLLRLVRPKSLFRVEIFLIGFCVEHLVVCHRSKPYFMLILYPILFFFVLSQTAWNAKYFLILLVRKTLSCVPPKKLTKPIFCVYWHEGKYWALTISQRVLFEIALSFVEHRRF